MHVACDELSYLGYIITPTDVMAGPAKVRAVPGVPIPQGSRYTGLDALPTDYLIAS